MRRVLPISLSYSFINDAHAVISHLRRCCLQIRRNVAGVAVDAFIHPAGLTVKRSKIYAQRE
jgi:hypothetical protein